MQRRRFLQGCGTVVLASSSVSNVPKIDATPSSGEAAFSVLVCGPEGGRTDRWARAVVQGLGALPVAPVRLRNVGGRDGVTGANRLQTLVVPDGYTAAMMPGSVSIAFLTGDRRVYFQPGDWIPIMAGLNAAVLVIRGGLHRLSDPVPIRLAASSPESPDLAALLAFHRLGIATAPVFGLYGASAVARAFASGEADAVLLTGEDIPADTSPLRAEGGVAIGTLGVIDSDDRIAPDPTFPNLPTIEALARSRRAPPLPAPLEQAYRAAAATARIDFMLVLPHLATPSTVAIWRQGAARAISRQALQAAAAASSIGLTVSGAVRAVAPFDVPADGLLALRQFLLKHYGWRPS